jgi:hypothetical protein
MQRTERKTRLSVAVILSLVLVVLLFGSSMPVNAAPSPSTNFSLNGYRVNVGGGGAFTANWTGGDLGNTWEEGDWVSYTLTITNVQTDYPSLAGLPDLVLGYHFFDSVHNDIFIDLVRDIQVGTTTLDDAHGFPTAGGGPQANTYAGAHTGQLDPAEHA